MTKVTGGDAPDIAIVPQPGLLQTLVGTGDVKKASDAVSSNVDKYWGKDWKSYGTVDGDFYAAPMLANVKGYVWYSPAKFKEWGVSIPKTYDELLTSPRRSSRRRARPRGRRFRLGDASGWPGTDWIEDLVLRQSGPEVYDQWVANEVKFTDPQIKEAFDAVGQILLNPAYVNAGFGDVKSINSVAFADVAAKVADGSCPMTHQASFLSSNFLTVKNAAAARSRSLPTVTSTRSCSRCEEGEQSVEGGGEFVATFSDDANVQKVAEFMSSPEFADARVKLGGVISANKGADPSLASSEFLQEAMKVVQNPRHHAPLRRVRPHAGHRRRRIVLEGHGELDRRNADRHGAQRHPGRLQQLTPTARSVGRPLRRAAHGTVSPTRRCAARPSMSTTACSGGKS